MIGVYFLESSNLIKIGSTVEAHKRLYAMQGQCPTKLTLIGFIETITRTEAFMLEFNLHRQFHKYRHHREWFKSSYEILEYVKINSKANICEIYNQELNAIYNTPAEKRDIILGQRSIISEIYQFVLDHPNATICSISRDMSMYESTVKTHLNKLQQEGLINKIKQK